MISIQGWDGALRIAYGELSFDQQKEALQTWVRRTHLPMRFVDVVIFHFVRHLLLAPAIKNEWIKRAIDLTIDTGDRSLAESLVWTLSRRCGSFPGFLEVAQVLRRSDLKIDRALRENGYA